MKEKATPTTRSTEDPHPPGEAEVTARVRRLQENGRDHGVSDQQLRERARAELEQERRQTDKTVRREPKQPPSTPE